MKKHYLMAVDLGTSFIKAGIYDLDGNCKAEASEPVKDTRPGPGIFIQKGDELFQSVVACMKNAAGASGECADSIEAIAFTGQMSGFMGVGRDWEDITTWSCSLDSRYMPYAQKQMEALRDPFLKTGGTNFPQMAPKYAWFQEEYPEESRKIAKYLMISGYVIGRLGNLPIEDAVIDRSYLSWTGLADMHRNSWSEEICGAVSIDRNRLPRIVCSNEICGRLCPEMAKATGIKSGVPLVSGAGDKIAGCLGAGAVEPGDLILEASSYGEISCCVRDYRPDMEERRLDVLASAIPGEYYSTHFAAGSGITLDWFVNQFIRRPGQGAGEAFAALEAESAKVEPGCGGLMAIGLLGGSSMPLDGALRGLFMGFDWSHGPAHFYRALLESFTYDFALALRSIERLYPEFPLREILMTGGGSKSSLWPQILAGVTGKEVRISGRRDGSLWGACILAGNAAGLFPDMKATARAFAPSSRTVQPDPSLRECSLRGIERYARSLTDFHDAFSRL